MVGRKQDVCQSKHEWKEHQRDLKTRMERVGWAPRQKPQYQRRQFPRKSCIKGSVNGMD